jgi:hypothetical protein
MTGPGQVLEKGETVGIAEGLSPLPYRRSFFLTVFFGRLNQYKRRRVRIPHTTHVLTDKQADRKLPLFFSLGIQSIDRSFHAPSLTYCVSIPRCDILPVMALPKPGASGGFSRHAAGEGWLEVDIPGDWPCRIGRRGIGS